MALEIAADIGVEVREIDIQIDYAIIEHFSRHLYSSPNKAIEELVANGFDARATRCRVFLPQGRADDSYVVWDNGESMDVDAIERLWWIAKSPKAVVGGDRVVGDGASKRQLIGKFGIGKLAGYSLGTTLTHICKSEAGFFAVSVDYGAADAAAAEAKEVEPIKTPVRELDEKVAEELVRGAFSELPEEFDSMFAENSWTFAVISNLRESASLTPGRLKWVLGNGMPLRDDFRVWVEGEPVQPKLESDALVEWHTDQQDLVDTVVAAWSDAAAEHGWEGEAPNLSSRTLDDGSTETVLAMPHLGDVRFRVRLFSSSLLQGRQSEKGRSHGFFIMVRGRLINADDDKFLLHDPSFSAFYRLQIFIYADGLDKDLLADRERFDRETPRVEELRLVQRSLYSAARKKLEALDNSADEQAASGILLPMESREFFREPLTALIVNRGMEVERPRPQPPIVERKDGSAEDSLAVFEPATGDFVVNTQHPFVTSVRAKIGDGRKAREMMRFVDVWAVAELLLEGKLFDMGIDRARVEEILEWRDGVLRRLGEQASEALDDAAEALLVASYKGSAKFEAALAVFMETLGYDADRDGTSGEKDVLVVAPIGESAYHFTMEAKGIKRADGELANDDAEISGAKAHLDKVNGATHAIVVARSFAGFKNEPRNQDAAILQECRSADNQVSIVTVETLIELAKTVRRFAYPLTLLLDILKIIEPPAEKLDRVRKLENPREHFDYAELLNRIWNEQRKRAKGDRVAIRTLWQEVYREQGLSIDEIRGQMAALETISGGLVAFKADDDTAIMYQSPEIVSAKIGEQTEV